MISTHCFTRDWIDRRAREARCQNPVLLEKAIVALQLIGHLAEAGLPFQFKGGTSLLLLVQPIRRLSIDADIVTQATPAELDQALAQVATLHPFTRIDHDPDPDRDLPPKKHYRAAYPSLFPPPQSHVLLDVLFEPAPAVLPDPIPIRVPFIATDRDVRVSVPGINGLLGDKLTAFAPQTIGILYRDDRAADILKQLFDVGILFDVATDLPAVAAAYEAVHANQCRYRGRPYTLDQTLDDTIQACLELTQDGLKGAPNDAPRGPFFRDGIAKLESHLLNDPFRIDHARIATGKAACLAAWIKRRPQDITIESMRFNAAQIAQLASAAIAPPWSHLIRLRSANPEAFHYWSLTQRLLNGGNA